MCQVSTLRSQQLFEEGTIINFILIEEKMDERYGIFLRWHS